MTAGARDGSNASSRRPSNQAVPRPLAEPDQERRDPDAAVGRCLEHQHDLVQSVSPRWLGPDARVPLPPARWT